MIAAALLAAALGTADWPTANGTLRAGRYAPLGQITTRNVGRLRERCSFSLGENVQFQASPLVVHGMLYTATFENTYAVDGRTCALRWKHHRALPKVPIVGAIRGTAYADGRLFVATYDGHVLALRATDGSVLWDRAVLPPASSAYFVAAPLAADGRVFIGSAGSEMGVAARIFGLDQRTGAVAWRASLVPDGNGPAARTWANGAAIRRAGGGTWTSFSFDPARHLLYVPAGNPAPDFDGDYRRGENLYTNAIVALDARSGALRAWHQLVPHDVHDWDVSTPPALVRTRNGSERAAVAGKDGYLYQLDAGLRRVLARTATTTMANGDAPITRAGTHFCPGVLGGTLFSGPAYSPQTDAFYVGSVDWCTTVQLGADKTAYVSGRPFLGSGNFYGTLDPIASAHGWLTAVDAARGGVRWRWRSGTPLVAAVLATAGGVLFTGDLDGRLLAFDAATGALLYRHALGAPLAGGIVCYAIDGEQLLAVDSGTAGVSWHLPRGEDRIVVFGL